MCESGMASMDADLLRYLKGQLSFEEFERRHDVDKVTGEFEVKAEDGEESGEEKKEQAVKDTATPSTSATQRNKTEVVESGVSWEVQKAFNSILKDSISEEEKEKNVEPLAEVDMQDVFAFEIGLHRENRRQMKERVPRSKLPKALRGLMGEANIRFARGDHEEAVKMCMEIIRQAPHAHEPFSTLAMLYEECGDMDKSLQFGLIAAYLNPSDPDEWVKLAEMSLELDNIKQAVLCYSKAIKYAPSKTEYLWVRSGLYGQLGDHKQAMEGYKRILQLLPPSKGEEYMKLTRDMARTFYESKDLMSAVGLMEEALGKHQNLVTMEDVHMAAELYIASKNHNKCFDVIVQFAGVKLNEEAGEDNAEGTITVCEPSVDTPIDVKAKLIVCLIHKKMLQPVKQLVAWLMEQSVEEVGDLYLDVAESFMETGEYEAALPLLSCLVCSEQYNLAAVWLRHAECLNSLGLTERAAQSYTRVVKMAPSHLGARITLSALQQQLGQPDKALQALQPPSGQGVLDTEDNVSEDIQLLLHRSTLLHSQGKQLEYLDSLLTMLNILLKGVMVRIQVSVVSQMQDDGQHLFLVKETEETTQIRPEAEPVQGKTSLLGKEEWWNLLLKTIGVLSTFGRHAEGEILIDTALEFYLFYDDRPKRKELECLGLSASLLGQDFRRAYNYMRLILLDNLESWQAWNIFNHIITHSQDTRHHRFCLRLLLKHPENLALIVLNGHNAFVAGSFKHALAQYMQALRMRPEDPLFCLSIGITFVHMASQKFADKRHSLLVQGFSFLIRYLEIRGSGQETYYNVGRALHQMGLAHLAIHYYQKALSCPPLKLPGVDTDQLDLRREIAYNLALIYQSSGNHEMARLLIITHCTI
uniref:general transcription factor 3C polypeptide 3 isoform X2 n=1 Tax=Myxine glutinosa TaxID=7769 RepID=UPI00358EFD87